MKTIGLLGGMSWESTRSYYSALNEGVKARLGGLHSAKICLVSVDFAEIEQLQQQGNWPQAATLLAQAARQVEAGGADGLLICTNTMHKVAPEISAAVSIPLLHIADATGQALQQDGIQRVGLLGTAFTMQQDFYTGRLREQFDLTVITPPPAAAAQVHHIIYSELCQGIIRPASREVYLQVISQLQQQGAEAVILGCTEIALLVQPEHTHVPLYDTTALHVEHALRWALAP